MTKWRTVAVAALGVTLAGSVAAASAQGTSLKTGSDTPQQGREVNVELVGQVTNSAPGVSPATSTQYGYLSYLQGLPIFTGTPNESTALFTFYIDTSVNQVLTNGPIRVIDRTGTMTIYKDSNPNGSFANPDSFRDGTPILVADLHQQVIVDTATGGFTAQNLNTISSTRRFDGPDGGLQLGTVREQFRTNISGHLNAAGSPSAYMAGYTYDGGRPTTGEG